MTDKEKAVRATEKMLDMLEKCCWLTDEQWKAVTECLNALCAFLPKENH